MELTDTLCKSTLRCSLKETVCSLVLYVAAYSFSLEDRNVSDLILGHPLFSPLSVVQIFGILKKIYKKPTMVFTRNNSFNLKNEHSKSIEKKTGTFFTVYCAFCLSKYVNVNF